MKLTRMRCALKALRVRNLFSTSINKFQTFFMIAGYQNIPKQMLCKKLKII